MKRVFISFRAEDRKQVDGLRLLAANPNFDIEFYDESVKSPYQSNDATYIRRQIKEKISRTSVTVCLLGPLTYTSEWVSWELEESFAKNNKVILMGLPGVTQSLQLPTPARQRNLPWYLWNIDELHKQIQSA